MMGKLGFSKGGRKKPPAQLALNAPMSKAHRILGSTPLNIDSPKAWDDGSSSFSAATVSTIPSYTGTEDDFSDHEVAIARSEGDWVDDSGLLPTVMESTSLDQVDDFSRTDPVRLLRKSQSSSTITPWYDESKTLSRPKQRVSLAPSTGSRHLSLKDDLSKGAGQGKKKPPKLDLTPNRRLSRKSSIPQLHTDGAIVGAPDSSIKSPSIFSSLLTPTGDRHLETRKIQKRLTKEKPHSPIIDPARPKTSDTTSSRVGTSSSREVPSLYDHYEQMMDRQFALDEASLEEEDEALENRDVMLRDSEVSPSTQSASHGSASPQYTPGADANPRRASTRTSKQVQPVNLQQSSMLMLSDSESDGEDTPQQRSFSRQSASAFPSSTRSSVQPHASVRASHSSRPSRTTFDIKGTRSNRSSKRTSFAPANTYIPHSNSGRNSEEGGDTSTNQDPRASMAFGTNSAVASCRASLMSNYSARSTGEYVHEAKAVRLLPARRPSKLTLDDDGNTGSHTSQSHSNGTQGNSDMSSDDELASSPLSQTSMEFFLRSAHSSIDGAGVRGRMMTVSREEEMLLESLRHKAKEAQEKNTAEPGSPKRRPSLTSSAKSITSDADSLLDQASTFEFDFPAPPSAKRDSLGISTRRSLSVRVRANGSVDKSQFATIAEEEVPSNEPRPASSTSSQRQQPVRGILKKTTHSLPPSQQSIQDYMNEDAEDSELDDFSEFDYLAPQTFEPQTFVSQSPATPSFSPKSPDDMEFLPSTRFGDPVGGGNKFRSTRESLKTTAISSENSANSLDSAISENADEAGVPRPDSPISPDAFPAVPQVRTRLNSIARLSAVGLPQA